MLTAEHRLLWRRPILGSCFSPSSWLLPPPSPLASCPWGRGAQPTPTITSGSCRWGAEGGRGSTSGQLENQSSFLWVKHDSGNKSLAGNICFPTFLLHQNLKYSFFCILEVKNFQFRWKIVDVFRTSKEGDVPHFSLPMISQARLWNCTELLEVCSPWARNVFYLCEMPAAGVLFLLGLVLADFMSPELV